MTHLESIKGKIIAGAHLERWLNIARFKNRKIVFTNGCFDILHRGHIHYLSDAADLGDFLVIGLNTDDSVRRIKGTGRPVNDEESRAMTLAALGFVSAVVFFDEDTPIGLIRRVRPDFLVKGGDYIPADIVGYDFVTSYGGKVIALQHLEGYSTSAMIGRINTGL